MKAKHTLVMILAFLLLTGLTIAGDKQSLPDRFRKWLDEEVVYIISPVEKEVFLQLTSDRERELFIEAFWKHRDPTLNSPENEFKDEHYKRIQHANHFFGRTSPKPGWRTDRGRIHIILGAPNDIQRFEGKSQIYNTELWFYQGLTNKGLPPGFNLIFFQDGGTGDYKLYSPLADGPQALMTSYFGDQTDYLSAYRELMEFEPELAPSTLSLIPGENAAVMGRPTMSSDILVNRVESTPLREIEEKYARKFLEYKDRVEVEYSANYMDSDSTIFVTREASGLSFVHYAVEVARLSVNQYQNKYYTTFNINGTVVDKEDRTVYQFEKSVPVDFEEERMKQVSHRPLSIRDMFPLIPGEYHLTVLVKNEISKEFTSLERDLLIPDADVPLQMTSLLLGFRMEVDPPSENRLRPFQAGRYRIYFQSNRVFLKTDDLVVAFQVHGLTPRQQEGTEIRFDFFRESQSIRTVTRRLADYPDAPNFVDRFPLQDLTPAHYRVQVSLIVDGQESLTAGDEFDLTYAERIPRPWVYGKLLASPDHPVYSFVTGMQLFNTGRPNDARSLLERAYRADPENAGFALNLARLYFQIKAYTEVPPVLSPLTERADPPQFEVFLLLGRAYQAVGELARAIEIFDRGMTHHGLSTNMLNATAECYFQLGKLEEARVAWEKSLEINQNQPKIKENINALKEKK